MAHIPNISATKANAIMQPQFMLFMKIPSPLPCILAVRIVSFEIGAPQWGQDGALSDTAR